MIIDMTKTSLSLRMDEIECDLPLCKDEQIQSTITETFGSQIVFVLDANGFQKFCSQDVSKCDDGIFTYSDSVIYGVNFDASTGNISWELVSWNASFPDE